MSELDEELEQMVPADEQVPKADKHPPRAASAGEPHRREFLKKSLTVLAGGTAVGVPAAAGLRVLLDPLQRASDQGGFVQITRLDALPEDGQPRRFQVVTDRTDAWNRVSAVPVGAVYLRRVGEMVRAFNARCPHLGCPVDVAADGLFKCPCHNSSFDADGNLLPGSVSPRGLDELEVDPDALREGIVMVKFQTFRTGIQEKIPQT